MKFGIADFGIGKIKGFKVLEIVKNTPILLTFDVSNSFGELISHTKYEQNWSIFDNFQNFGPFYFDDTEKPPPKFLICCYKKVNLP